VDIHTNIQAYNLVTIEEKLHTHLGQIHKNVKCF